MTDTLKTLPATPSRQMTSGTSRPDAGDEAGMVRMREAQAGWAAVPLRERLKVLHRLRGWIAENAMTLANSSAVLRSRPVAEALTAEVLPLAEACRFLEREAGTLLAARHHGRRTRPFWLGGVTLEVRREPWGVILILGPSNYPLLLPGVQLIQALAAGNAVLLKPGTGATAPMQLLLRGLLDSGLPGGLVRILDESLDSAIEAIDMGPDKVILTGRTSSGIALLERLAPKLIPATLELGGNDPVIVGSDADLDLTAKALAFGLTLNGGATCMAPTRVFVHESVAAPLARRLQETLSSRPTPPRPAGRPLLPLRRIQEMLDSGARLLHGTIEPEDALVAPVVLAVDRTQAWRMDEEIFGPFLAIVATLNNAESVLLANECKWALGASVFTADPAGAERIVSSLRAGVVTVNDVIVPTGDPRLPFGGRGASGHGSTRGGEGLLEMTVPKAVTVSRSRFRPAFEPTRPGDPELFTSYMALVHGSGWKVRLRGLQNLLLQLKKRS